jgi:hypothetical protein
MLSFLIIDASKIEQNGAVLTEDARVTNMHILKATSRVSSDEKFVEKNY